MQHYIDVLKKYAVFEGRARRKEYWMFTLFNTLISLGISVLEIAAGMEPVLSALYALAVFLPSLGVFIRRMHDIGKSGWWFFLGLIPFIGGIILLVFECTDSEKGDNKYGPNPKQGETIGFV